MLRILKNMNETFDYMKCPDCGGPTEFDRCVPPNPYVCDECMEKKYGKYEEEDQ